MKIINTINYLNQIKEENKVILYESLKDSFIRNESYKLLITKWMALMVFLYFLFNNEKLQELEISGIKIPVSEYFEILSPLIISVLILFYIVVSIENAQVQKTYNILFQNVFGISSSGEDMRISRQTLPIGVLFSILNQNDMNHPKGCFYNILISIPIALIQIVPYIFIVFSMTKIYFNHFDYIWGKVSLILTIYFIIFGIYLFSKYIMENTNENLKLKELK